MVRSGRPRAQLRRCATVSRQLLGGQAAVGGARGLRRAPRSLATEAGSVKTARTVSLPPHRTQTRRSTSKVRFNKVRQSIREVVAQSSPWRIRSQWVTDSTFGATCSAAPVVVSVALATPGTTSRTKAARPSPASCAGRDVAARARRLSRGQLRQHRRARGGAGWNRPRHHALAPPMARREHAMASAAAGTSGRPPSRRDIVTSAARRPGSSGTSPRPRASRHRRRRTGEERQPCARDP